MLVVTHLFYGLLECLSRLMMIMQRVISFLYLYDRGFLKHFRFRKAVVQIVSCWFRAWNCETVDCVLGLSLLWLIMI